MVHLLVHRSQKKWSPDTWQKRLGICIGNAVARGVEEPGSTRCCLAIFGTSLLGLSLKNKPLPQFFLVVHHLPHEMTMVLDIVRCFHMFRQALVKAEANKLTWQGGHAKALTALRPRPKCEPGEDIPGRYGILTVISLISLEPSTDANHGAGWC